MDEAWMEFMVTGKVDDYLRYKNTEGMQQSMHDTLKLWEEIPNGTEYCSNRDGFAGNADWRI